MAWLESAPLWLIGLAMVTLLLAANLAGYLVGRIRRSSGEDKGYMVSSALAMLGLLMAFTFGAAQDRFRVRQDLVVAEANAIGTTYLRVQLVEEPWRGELSRLMADYVRLRVEAPRLREAAAIAANRDHAGALRDAIWRSLREAIRNEAIPTVGITLVNSVNETFDLADARRAALEARVPVTIIRVLLVSSVIAAAVVGQAERQRGPALVYVGTMLLLSLAFVLILDLDRPTSGAVIINQAPMQRALQSLEASERAKAAQGPPMAAGPSAGAARAD